MTNRYVLILIFLCLLPFSSLKAAPLDQKVCVMVSREIRPFLMTVEALENSLDFSVDRVYLDSSYRAYGENGKFLEISQDDYKLFVAVGPRALSYLLEKDIKRSQIIFGMVLNPESFITESDTDVTGVPLDIFSLTQFNIIKKVFPDIKKVGVLYDPENNEKWINTARFLAGTSKIQLIPLAVSTGSMIPAVLDENAATLDAVLFIPDATVISTTIIKHSIKQLILKQIPAIGYNSFFIESGAVLSFIVDYEKVGRQLANLIYESLSRKEKVSVGSIFKVVLNKKVIDLLGMKTSYDLPENVEIKR